MRRETTLNDFGLLIAYVLPGYAVLWSLSQLGVPMQSRLVIGGWAPTLAGFLYSTLAAVAAGLTVSAVRWLIVDTLHHRTGVPPPAWDFDQLGERAGAFEVLIDIHYKYYQFYANMLVSLVWVYGVWRWTHPAVPSLVDAAFALLALVYFLGSRDALRKYYLRGGQLLRRQAARDRRPAPLG